MDGPSFPSDLSNTFARSKREDTRNTRYKRMSRGVGFDGQNEASNDENHNRIRRQSDEIFPTLPIVPNVDEIAETVGEYSFGLRTIYPPGYIESDPVLVRYSGRYILIGNCI